MATALMLLIIQCQTAIVNSAFAQNYNTNPYASRYDAFGPNANGRGNRQHGAARNAAQAQVGFAPPGLVLTLVMMTSLSSRTANRGDPVQASLTRNVVLQGGGLIPAGSIVSGEVIDARGSAAMEQEGSLSLTFNRLTLPDGRTFAISANVLSGLGNVGSGNLSYADTHGSVGYRNRMENMGVSAAAGNLYEGGVGLAAAPLYGANFTRGLLSPNTLFGGANVLRGTLRRGHNVIVPSGVPFQIRLNSALTIRPPGENQAAPGGSQGSTDSGF